MNRELSSNAANEIIKNVPPVTVVGIHLFGYAISDVTLMCTAIYTLFLLFFLLKDKIFDPFMERRRLRKSKKAHSDV